MSLAEKRGRRPDPAKDEAILKASRTLFSERGYGVSMDEIAAEAGVSKQTLYARFPGKAELFAAGIRNAAEDLLGPLFEDESRPPREALNAFGDHYVGITFDEKRIALQRVLIAEAAQFPDLARAFFENGPMYVKGAVAEYLARETKRGRLNALDADEAASQLLGMIKGSAHLAALLGVAAEPSRAALEKRVRNAVAAFLKIYGV